MPDPQRLAILQGVANVTNTVPNVNGIWDPNQILTQLQKINGLKNLSIAPDGCVVGLFSDGVPFTFGNNLSHDTSKTAAPVRTVGEPAEAPHSREAPSSNVAVIMDSQDSFFLQYRKNSDENLFNANGYPGTTFQKSTVKNLRTLGNASQAPIGCLCLEGHGLPAYESKDLTQPIGWGMWTSDRVDQPTPEDKEDFRAGLLGIGFAPANVVLPLVFSSSDFHYVILPQFISHYKWNLAKNSMVFLTMCSGGSPQAANFRAALSAQGASSIAGYTSSANVPRMFVAQTYLLARMLGADIRTGVYLGGVIAAGTDDSQGRRRPFDNGQIEPVLDASGITLYADGTHLNIFDTPTAARILNPSLQFTTASPGVLNLFGSFGARPGTVTVGGTALTTTSWSSTFIKCALPGNLSGDIVVSCPFGTGKFRMTNARQLTRWSGTLTDTFVGQAGAPVATASGTFNLSFQQDIGDYYGGPAVTLSHNSSGSMPFFAGSEGIDSTCSVNCTPSANFRYVGPATYTAIAGGPAIVLASLVVPLGGGTTGQLLFDAQDPTGLTSVQFGGGFDFELRNALPGNLGVPTTFDAHYNMAAGSNSFSDPLPENPGTDSYNWTAFTPTSLPSTDPNKPR